MLDLARDPRTSDAYRDARDRAAVDPALRVPGSQGEPVDLLLRVLGVGEWVDFISWAVEVADGPARWWVVALSRERLVGVSPSSNPRSWSVPLGQWSISSVKDDVLLRMRGGPPLRVKGAISEHGASVFRTERGLCEADPPAQASADGGIATVANEQAAMSGHEAAVSTARGPETLPDESSGADKAIVSTWQEAEGLAAWHMKQLGFSAVSLTPPGADGGIDVVGTGVAAQVKHHSTAPVGSPAVQQLRGAAVRHDWSLFYSRSGFTRGAVEFAESAQVALFAYNDGGLVQPVSDAAKHLVKSVGLAQPPNIDGFELERETKKVAEEYFNASLSVFMQTVESATERVAPRSHLFMSAQVELTRVQSIVRDIGSRTVRLTELFELVEKINAATERLIDTMKAKPDV